MLENLLSLDLSNIAILIREQILKNYIWGLIILKYMFFLRFFCGGGCGGSLIEMWCFIDWGDQETLSVGPGWIENPVKYKSTWNIFLFIL